MSNYWRKVSCISAVLTAVVLAVVFAVGVLHAEFSFGALGGVLLVFMGVLVAYAMLMDRIE